MEYIAHRSEDWAQVQTIEKHLENVANLAKRFAGVFAPELAAQIGLLHDIGKYSSEFQERISGKNIKVDHSTAGGQYAFSLSQQNALNYIVAYCVMGHHSGLPNGGTDNDKNNIDLPTLSARKHKIIPQYASNVESKISLPTQLLLPNQNAIPKNNFEMSVLIRMLFSSLVDADWLDTEAFMQNGALDRSLKKTIPELWTTLSDKIKDYITPKSGASELNKLRSQILNYCLASAEINNINLFSLTAPTGSGKTISSLAFALKHAFLNNKSRIIYVVPYNTIIEQNAKVFENLLGEENVLQHHNNIDYETKENEVNIKKQLATENWDYPVIVTSSVQFFESLFSVSPSKCRKLHNIANSVIVFDEAQMIPQGYLKPCTAIISSLIELFSCTAVLTTATQADLEKYIGKKPIEIVQNIDMLFNKFRRACIEICSIQWIDDELIEKIAAQNQVLCIVNTRKKAQELFSKLSGDGIFHLSTTMHPKHRSETLRTIREKLSKKETCKVISTSLIEAGVDVDFPIVFREETGLDSIIQSAGRCNREGKNALKDSKVIVFKLSENNIPNLIKPNIGAEQQIIHSNPNCDLFSADIITKYFAQLFYNVGDEALDKKQICKKIKDTKQSCLYPFRDIADDFKIIEENKKTIYVLSQNCDLISRIDNGERTRKLFHELGQYGVSLYSYDFNKLNNEKSLVEKDEEIYILADGIYNEQTGIPLIENHNGLIIV